MADKHWKDLRKSRCYLLCKWEIASPVLKGILRWPSFAHFSVYQNHPEGLLKHTPLIFRVNADSILDSIGLGMGLIIRISNKFPGDADGLEVTF